MLVKMLTLFVVIVKETKESLKLFHRIKSDYNRLLKKLNYNVKVIMLRFGAHHCLKIR